MLKNSQHAFWNFIKFLSTLLSLSQHNFEHNRIEKASGILGKLFVEAHFAHRHLHFGSTREILAGIVVMNAMISDKSDELNKTEVIMWMLFMLRMKKSAKIPKLNFSLPLSIINCQA